MTEKYLKSLIETINSENYFKTFSFALDKYNVVKNINASDIK
jgi:hypothetical protein